jgi:hypothetical protein
MMGVVKSTLQDYGKPIGNIIESCVDIGKLLAIRYHQRVQNSSWRVLAT